MAQYTLIEQANGKSAVSLANRRTFPITKETRERLAMTQRAATREVGAVHIHSSAFDHAMSTMRIQA